MKAESYDMYVLRIKIKHERSSLIVTQTVADTGFWVKQDAKVFMAREAPHPKLANTFSANEDN